MGNYYLRARYYDADTGRFTRRDDYEGRLGEPLTLHKYIYTHANPVNGIDPSGNLTLTQVLAVTANIGRWLIGTTLGRIGLGVSGALAVVTGPFFWNSAFTSRNLDSGEKNLAQSIFGSSINYEKVKIAQKPITAALTSALVWGNTIYADKNSSGFIGDEATFIHEMTHIWQYQNNGLWYALKSAFEQITKGRDDAYDNWEQSYDSLGFEGIGAEEQAELVKEYYIAKRFSKQARVKKLQPVINNYIRQGRGAQ